MADRDFSWALPVMRCGYGGRALVYLVVAGFSLWAIWHGQQAKGTGSALAQLESTSGGLVVLVAIFLGMLAYALWRVIDAAYDLEDYGTDGEGAVARIGMVVTGLIHLGIGVAAFSLIFASGGGGGGSGITRAVGAVMGWPGGRWIVGIAGLATIGAAIYYLHKAWTQNYRQNLIGNHFTRNWDPALRGGVASQGFVVGVIGVFLIYAALLANPDQAGGVGQAFAWLSEQAYGRVLVGLLCIGLLGFALFCAVNAAYRLIPKVRGRDGLETLAMKFKAKAT